MMDLEAEAKAASSIFRSRIPKNLYLVLASFVSIIIYLRLQNSDFK